jgi:hypothetical protein
MFDRSRILAFATIALCFHLATGQAQEGRAVAGVGGVAVSSLLGHDAALSRCVGGSPDQPSRHSDFEAHAAVNPSDPRQVAAAWMTVGGNRSYIIRASVSSDGGENWMAPVTLPFVACAGNSLPDLHVATDPWVAFGPEGRLYVSAQAYSGKAGGHAGLQHISVITSGDGGRSWDLPQTALVVHGPSSKFDNTAVTADPIHPGTAYVLATEFQHAEGVGPQNKPSRNRIGQAALSKTTDGGKTWGPRQLVSPDLPGTYADLPQMVVDPQKGRLLIFYSSLGADESAINFVASGDEGRTWSPPARVCEYVRLRKPPRRPMAEDVIHPTIDSRSGRLYVVFVDGRFTAGEYSQVAITSSMDGGRTWTKPAPVSTRSDRPAWLPSIAAGESGTIGVSYFDAPRDSTATTTQVSLWKKTFALNDNGDPVAPHEDLVDRFPLLKAISWEGFFLGDYFALLNVPGGFRGIYVKSFTQRNGSARTAVYFSH